MIPESFLKNSSTCFGCGGAAALADAGLAAAPAIEGGVEGFGEGADIAAGACEAVAGALLVGGQSGAQAGGGLAQPRSQTVQAVRVEAGNDPDGGPRRGRAVRPWRRTAADRGRNGQISGRCTRRTPGGRPRRSRSALAAEQGADVGLTGSAWPAPPARPARRRPR